MGSSPSRSATSTEVPSGSAAGRSILFTTGTISRPFSIARYALASVCASIPCAASTTRSAPSHAWSERDTSYVKSTWPGVSMRLSSCPFHETRTACALIVMPRSRSSSIESSSWSRMSRAATASVTSRMRSASVDLPWSMCAMIEKLRMRPCSIPSAMVLGPVVRGRGRSGRGQTAPPPRVGSHSLRPRDRGYPRIGAGRVTRLSQLSGKFGRPAAAPGRPQHRRRRSATRPSRTRRASRARARTPASARSVTPAASIIGAICGLHVREERVEALRVGPLVDRRGSARRTP